MNTETDNQFDELEQAVLTADENIPATKTALAESAAELKTAKANASAAVKYRKAIAEDADEITLADADSSVSGWDAEVDRLAEVHEANKTAKQGAAGELKDAKKALRDAKAEAKKAEKADKPEREKRNGMVRPINGGPSNIVWDAADAAQAALGRVPALGDIHETVEADGVKLATMRAAYAHWRKFHGVTGRIESAEQVEAREAKEAEKLAKAEEREAAKQAKAAEKEAAAKAEATVDA